MANMHKISACIGCNFAWLAIGEGPKYPPANSDDSSKGNIGVQVQPNAISGLDKYEILGKEVAEWARAASEKSGVFDYCDGIRIAIAQTYPEFEEWLKKRNNGGDMETMPRKKVSNSD